MLPVIALVGRPNVGKSTLFNRVTKTRDALVASIPGLTRDRQYGRGVMGDFDYLVIDTGGLSGDEQGIDKPMAEQSRAAISEADLVLFLVDAKSGRLPGDHDIARLLRTQNKPVVLVANKIDGQNSDYIEGEFAELGFGGCELISASNGHGVSYLMSEVVLARLPVKQGDETEAEEARGIKMAVVGRPNVGKSTLVNRMLGEDRVVVFDQAGTTRDSIYIPFEREGQEYTIIDTAGVRRRGKISEAVEKFSVIKALDAIADANVVILMIDAHENLVDQDLHLLGHVLEAGRALVIAVNKWDGTNQEQKDHIKSEIERRLTFIDFATIHFISALHGSGVGHLYKSVLKSYDSATKSLATTKLNKILAEALAEYQPPMVNGRRIKLRYAHAGGSNPPIIIVHGNQTEAVPEAYKRYLQKRFHKALGLEGTPLRIEFRTGDNPFKDKKVKLTDREVSKKRRLMKDDVERAKRRKR